MNRKMNRRAFGLFALAIPLVALTQPATAQVQQAAAEDDIRILSGRSYKGTASVGNCDVVLTLASGSPQGDGTAKFTGKLHVSSGSYGLNENQPLDKAIYNPAAKTLRIETMLAESTLVWNGQVFTGPITLKTKFGRQTGQTSLQ